MQSTTQTNSSSKSQPARTPQKAGASKEQNDFQAKSLTAVIGEGLGEDVQKQIEDTMDQASKVLKTTKSYVTENRNEAIALAAVIGIGTWALLFTKPGRQIFEAAAPKVLPMISNLVQEVLNPEAAAKSSAKV